MFLQRQALAIVALVATTISMEAGSNYNTGPTGEYNGSIWTGGGYDPYTLNAHRKVRDLIVRGAVTRIPLTFTRYLVTRTTQSGFGTVWTYNWMWLLKQENTSNQYVLLAPSGENYTFPMSSLNSGFYFSQGATGLQMTINTAGWPVVYLRDGSALTFGSVQSNKNNEVDYSLSLWTDPYGQALSLTQNLTASTLTVTEPGGRWIEIYNPNAVTKVTTSDGQLVTFSYKTWTLKSKATSELASVNYEDNTSTAFAYKVDPSGTILVPSLITDTRFGGAMESIQYAYQTVTSAGSPSSGEISSESDSLGNLVSAIADISNPGHNAAIGRKETTGDGRIRRSYYNANGQLIEETDYEGNSTKYGWDSTTGYLKTVTDALTNTKTYTREPRLGQISGITYPDGSSVSKTFSNSTFPYYVASKTDERGYTTTYLRYPSNLIQQINYPDGGTESFQYNSLGQVTAHQTRSGGVYQMQYDNTGLLTAKIDPSGNTYQYYYDSRDRTKQVYEFARQQSTYYSYDDRDHVNQITYPDGTSKSKYFDPNTGDLLNYTNELGKTWTLTYDEYHRKKTYEDPLGNTTTYTYPASSSTTFRGYKTVTTQEQRETIYTYNPNWTVSSKTVGAGTPDAAETQYQYDSDKNLSLVKDPLGNKTTYTYWPRNWKKTSADARGKMTQYFYDPHGNLSQVTRPLGDSISYSYDKMNRRNQIQGPVGDITQLTFNPDGTLAQRIDPNMNSYVRKYDNMRRVLEADYPDGTKENWQYYVFGPKETFTNRNGDLANYTYDPRNRLLQKSWTTGLATTYTWDQAGNRKTISNYAAIDQFTPDDDNRLSSEIQQVTEGGWIVNQGSVNYSYGGDGLVQNKQLFEGATLSYAYGYTYTARDQVNIIDPGDAKVALASYTYDLAGNRLQESRISGEYTTYTYDPDNQISNITEYEANNTNPVLTFNYTPDDDGRIQTIQHVHSGATLSFAYDADDRLLQYTNPGQSLQGGLPEPPATSIGYNIDLADNRTEVNVNGAGTQYAPNNLNQYASVGPANPTYDNNGNLTGYNGWTFTYDAENHLRTVSGPSTTIQYDYDGLGRCVVQTVNGAAQFNIYDRSNLLTALNSTGSQLFLNVYGARREELLSTFTSTKLYYYCQDQTGNVTALGDQLGKIQEIVDYDPYGQPYLFARSGQLESQSQFGNVNYFAGRPYTPLLGWSSGIYNMHARFYSADLGRFMQTDPIGFKGGSNLYGYCRNNPVCKVDSKGTDGVWIVSYPAFFGLDPVSHLDIVQTFGDGPPGPGNIEQTLGFFNTPQTGVFGTFGPMEPLIDHDLYQLNNGQYQITSSYQLASGTTADAQSVFSQYNNTAAGLSINGNPYTPIPLVPFTVNSNTGMFNLLSAAGQDFSSIVQTMGVWALGATAMTLSEATSAIGDSISSIFSGVANAFDGFSPSFTGTLSGATGPGGWEWGLAYVAPDSSLYNTSQASNTPGLSPDLIGTTMGDMSGAFGSGSDDSGLGSGGGTYYDEGGDY